MQSAEGITIGVEEAEGRRVLRIGGEVCLPAAAALKRALVEALGNGRNAVLELSGVTNADLCGLQLLCSAHRTFLKQGADLRLGRVAQELLRTARSAGYEARTAICPYRRDSICLWNDRPEESGDPAADSSGGEQCRRSS